MSKDTLRWDKVDSIPGPELPLFRVRLDAMRHPTQPYVHRCLVLEAPDWVNVVAMTSDRRLVMVEQYRFGSGEISLEPPAGIVEPDEAPLAAAQRELLEETGYGGGTWRYLGAVQPNPAFLSNLCHHWLAEDVVLQRPPQPDPGEALRVGLMTPQAVRDAVAAGRVQHVLAHSALSRVFPLWTLPHVVDGPGAGT